MSGPVGCAIDIPHVTCPHWLKILPRATSCRPFYLIASRSNSKQFRQAHLTLRCGAIGSEPPTTLVRGEFAKLHDPQVSARSNERRVKHRQLAVCGQQVEKARPLANQTI